ncbi:hypothetical protein AWC38_SpisGene18979 [Stylophora pistillata]|uniref:Integrase catalytic domain-containing protein n=1 Tax=Stylophora pistillata TaxID=50429 RepID=A0A2B4RK39_STYPI|nr:hypothetical protein AWC38_SpisGene18979 [Stylophora pistillata]
MAVGGFKPKHFIPSQGDFPRDRTEGQTLFQVVGADCAGPLKYRKNAKTKGKAYVLMYACSLTRALFLDLLPNMETKEFLASFKHFVARRGRPQKVYSDNGRTFVGAAQRINQVKKDERFQKFLAYKGNKWQFNLSSAPWWGGQLERMEGLAKGALYKLTGNGLPSWTELEEEHDLRKRAKYLRGCKDTLWSRWTREYLRGLRERHRLKHKGDVTYPSRGEVVIIKLEEKNRAQ